MSMSNINLKRFVDVDITQHVSSTIVGTRNTAVLFTPDGTLNTTHIVGSLEEAAEYYSSSPNTLAYLSVFFDNGGVNCKVIEGISYSDLTTTMISELQNDEIIVACVAASTDVSACYAKLKELATTRESSNSVYGINEKIILARTYITSDSSLIKNFAVKYSNILGAEMTIAAYLTKIDVYKENSVRDYMFTQETITAENISDSDYALTTANNLNVDVNLADAVRNLGGNCKNGSDLTNTFVKIVLHQTLTEKLVSLLTTKLKNEDGISKIYAAIVQELENYRTCGYLTTDKIWTDEDYTITYNSTSYTIIEKGTALTTGYFVKVLPMSSLTDADKIARKTPPIYVIIADQYGIRKITISGEVI